MTSYSCKYHSDREAVTKCEMCGAMICLECKNVYNRTYHSSHNHYSYSTRYELCPECYAKKINQSYNPLCFCFPAIFIIFFIVMASSMFSEAASWGMGPPAGFSAMFFIIPIFGLCLLGYQYFIRGPQVKEEAENRKRKALKDLHGRNYTKSPQEISNNYAPRPHRLFCQNCGQPLDPKASFCQNCGNPAQK